MSDDHTIYERLGGEAAVAAVVDEFYDRVLADEQLAGYFAETDLDALRDHQTKFISHVTGGPVTYDGPDMREAHAHLDLDESDFVAIAGHLRDSLAAFEVSQHHADAIVGEVAALEDDVLNR